MAAYTGAFLYRFYFVDSFELYLLSGVAFATALAAVVGLLCARTTKIFFAIVTLAAWCDDDHIAVSLRRMRSTFYDAMIFVGAVPLLEILERLQDADVLPVLLRLS